jgi:hypothetical protein
MRAPPCRIEAGAAAPSWNVYQNRSGAAWQRLNSNTIFKRRSRVAGVKPWFRIVRQPKIS